MSKKPLFITTADMHLRSSNPAQRIDDYKAAMASKLSQIRNIQLLLNVPVIDSGDVFNGWKASPSTECFAMDNLPEYFLSIPGNHEIPFHNMSHLDESSFMVMLKAKRIKTDSFLQTDKLSIYMVPYNMEIPQKDLPEDTINVLVTHMMVTKETDTRFEHITAIDMLKRYPEYDVILAGHNHQSFTEKYKGRLLINNGSLMRSSYDQIDHKPCVHVVYEDLSFDIKYLEISPAEKVFNIEKVEAKKESEERIENFVSKLKSDYDVGVSFSENLKNYLSSNKIRDGIKEVLAKATGAY
jgi:DNA repair exonuclease SbcCD nuclease subunit